MARVSARLLGKELGKNAHEVNLMLKKIGFLRNTAKKSQAPVWKLTRLGKLHGEQSHHPYSAGHIWDPDVADILKKAFKINTYWFKHLL